MTSTVSKQNRIGKESTGWISKTLLLFYNTLRDIVKFSYA